MLKLNFSTNSNDISQMNSDGFNLLARNSSIDSLRSISVMMVVLLHIAAPLVYSGIKGQLYDSSFWVGNLIDSFSRVCVPVFVLISGAFLLGKNNSPITFYKKRVSRIIWPILFWTIAYSFYTVLEKLFANREVTAANIIDQIISGKPYYHLWYLYMLVGLYLITPLINKLIKEQSSKTVVVIASFFLIIGFSINITKEYYNTETPFITWFIEYLGYFMIGYIISNSNRFYNKFYLIAIYSVASFTVAILTYYFENAFFYNYLFPAVIISSIALFKIFSQSRITSSILSRCSKWSFGVYLVHAAVLDILNTIVHNLQLTTTFIVVDIALKFFIVMAISLTIIIIIDSIPKLNRVI